MEGLEEAGCTLLQLDVTDPASIEKARDEVLGQIRKDAELVLINNAGIAGGGPMLDVDIDAAKRVHDTNVWAVLRVCKAFAPHMIKAGHGRIINVRPMRQAAADCSGDLNRRLPGCSLCALSRPAMC